MPINLTQNQSKELFFAILHFKGGNSTRSQTSEKIKNAKSPNNNKQLESFFGLANVYRKMIPDFATNMLPLNDMRNSNFSWGNMQQESAFEKIKHELCVRPVVQPYSVQNEATITSDAYERAIGGIISQTHSILYVSRLLNPELLKNWAGSTGNCVVSHKIEPIPSWKTIYPTDGSQNARISLSARWGDPEDSISWNHAMGNNSNWLRLWAEVRQWRADASRRCFEQNDRVCLIINQINFAQSDLMIPAEIKTNDGKHRLFQDIMKRIKSSYWKKCSEAEKGTEQQKDTLTSDA